MRMKSERLVGCGLPAVWSFACQDGGPTTATQEDLTTQMVAGLFGWGISRRPVEGYDYFDIDVDGDLTAGIRHEPDGPAEIVIYVEVGDLDQAVEDAEGLGARVRIPPMEHGELRFALIEDPEGNPVGLTQRPALRPRRSD